MRLCKRVCQDESSNQFTFPDLGTFHIHWFFGRAPNVSVNFKPGHPLRATPRVRTFSLSGGSGFRPTSFAPGGRGFELEKFSTVLKEQCKNFWICFKETVCAPVLFHINFCIFNNIDEFWSF